MFDYLTKASTIHLKEFTEDSINYLGWELNFSLDHQDILNTAYTVSMNTSQWERLSWKTANDFSQQYKVSF